MLRVKTRTASFSPNASSPTRLAPSSRPSISCRNCSPREAVASTTSPSRKRNRTSSTWRPLKTAGKVKLISPSALSSSGAVKTSPSGKFSCPSAPTQRRSPPTAMVRSVPSAPAAADGDGQVGPLGDEAQLLLRGEQLDHPLQLAREPAPALDRVAVVEQRRVVEEVLVLGQRHLGVLGRAVRRIAGQHPAQLAGQRALEVALADPLPRALDTRLALGIDRRERLRVGRRLDHDPDVGLLDVLELARRQPLDLLVAALAEQQAVQLRLAADGGLAAGTQHGRNQLVQ